MIIDITVVIITCMLIWIFVSAVAGCIIWVSISLIDCEVDFDVLWQMFKLCVVVGGTCGLFKGIYLAAVLL